MADVCWPSIIPALILSFCLPATCFEAVWANEPGCSPYGFSVAHAGCVADTILVGSRVPCPAAPARSHVCVNVFDVRDGGSRSADDVDDGLPVPFMAEVGFFDPPGACMGGINKQHDLLIAHDL